MTTAQILHDIHYFWFGDLGDPTAAPNEDRTKLWFGFSPQNDEEIKSKYSDLLEDATQGKLDEWKNSTQGTMALILVLDQFSRQIHRKTDKAFAYDSMALEIAQYAVANGIDKNMHFAEKVFCYLPFEHSEEEAMQRRSVSLYSQLLERTSEAQYQFAGVCLKMAREHLSIIEKFGRFPHRNEALGRESSEEEIQFLSTIENRFGQ